MKTRPAWRRSILATAFLTLAAQAAVPAGEGGMPQVGQQVVALGFPRGGTRVTVTTGILSRIDRAPYKHSQYANLVGQIDAALNEGSSGGPILGKDQQLVGVAFGLYRRIVGGYGYGDRRLCGARHHDIQPPDLARLSAGRRL